MVHAPHTKFHVVSTVLTSGYDGNLAKGQFAVVKNKAVKGKGKEVISNFDGLASRDLISFQIGEVTTPSRLRTTDVPTKSTGFFSIGSIVDIKAYAPSNVTLKVDHLEIGYDGINSATGLYIPEGKAAVMDIVVEGQVASMFFGLPSYTIQKRAYRAVGETMQAVTRRLVKEINEDVVPTATGWASTTDTLSQFLEVGVIDSTTPELTGTINSVFAKLNIVDAGDSNDLADIQAQYPLYKVVRTARDSGTSEYTVVIPSATTLANYAKTIVDVDGKTCEDCLAGYTEVAGGYVYHIAVEDDGANLTTTVAGLFSNEISVVKFGNSGGKGVYSVLLPNTLTDTQITAITVARPEAEVTFKGDVKKVCSKTSTTSTAWVNGDTCFAQTKNFSIVLPDNECGESRLVELQKAYSDLTVVEGAYVGNVVTPSVGGCKRAYSTKIVTNVVCDECDSIYTQPFYAEAPNSYNGINWVAEATTFDENAKMGIFIKGKPFNLYPEAYEEDFIPFVETSLKVRSASFGWREDDILNYTGAQYNVALELAKVVKLQYAVDVNNLSQSLFGAEDEGNFFGTGKTKHSANLFARANLSQERQLKYNKRILKYVVEYRDTTLSQGGGSRSDITHGFGILVEEGKHNPVELILSKLAAKVGLPAVVASAT